jgi:hypothetical protein
MAGMSVEPPEDIRAFALGGLTRRLDIMGVPLDTL